ncbi:MAG: prolyl oligopeptidase family serine peptidase [Candidatus Poribacteria bacterium]|nr:prolyl oligopeptidase family serine peptidase [Candidatus Poribacteria bacterium]
MHTEMLRSIEDILSIELLTLFDPIAASPDGTRLAVAVQNYSRKRVGTGIDGYIPTGLLDLQEGSEIWLVNVQSGESRNLTPNWGTSYCPAWSPDGKRLAFYSDKHETAQLWIWEVGEDEPQLASDVMIRPFLAFTPPPLWTPDGTRIIVRLHAETETGEEPPPDQEKASVSVFESPIAGQSENAFRPRRTAWFDARYRADIGIITVATGEVQTLAHGFYPSGIRVAPDGSAAAFMSFQGIESNSQLFYDLYLSPLNGGPPKLLADSLKFSWGLSFTWSPNGRYIAYMTENKEAKDELFLISTTDGSQLNLTQDTDIELTNGSHPPLSPLWSSDSKHLFWVARGDLWRISVADKTVEKLTDGFDRHVVRIVRCAQADTVWAPDNAEVIYIHTVHFKNAQSGLHRVNLKTHEITQLVEEKRNYNPMGRNMDVAPQTGNIFYSIEDVRHPPDVWVADANFQNPRQLTQLNPNIETEPLGTSQIVTWQTPSGKNLRGALLLPPNYVEGKRYPLITQVYGGKFLSYQFNDFGTDHHGGNFLLTNQGYAVFLPDTPMETNAPVQELAEMVLSGIDTLIDMGIADPNRLGIMGHSYGGYCVNALITQTPRFAAAVSSAGRGNLISSYGHLTEEGDSMWIHWTESGQAKMGGSLWKFRDRYIENSPIFFLDKVETPLLLVVGALDVPAVPQAGEMFSGLRRLGKKAVLARYEGEGHAQVTSWRYPNVFDYWQRVLAWFDEHFPESV